MDAAKKTSSLSNEHEQIPDLFVCPLSQQIFVDPVVVFPDGISYERSAVEGEGMTDLLQVRPNRALKSMIEKSVVFPTNTNTNLNRNKKEVTSLLLLPTLEFLLQSFFQHLKKKKDSDSDSDINANTKAANEDTMDTSPSSSVVVVEERPWYRPPEHFPDELFCPITACLLQNPVIDRDGYSYDRSSLIEWLRRDGTSPITRKPLSAKEDGNNGDILPNRTLQQYLQMEMARPPSQRHHMLKQWMEEESAFQRKYYRWRRQRIGVLLRRIWVDYFWIIVCVVVVVIVLGTAGYGYDDVYGRDVEN